jgi:hypothetical protein
MHAEPQIWRDESASCVFGPPVAGSPTAPNEEQGARMFAALRRYEGITDPAAVGELVDESFMPLLEHLPGFIAYYWIDAGDGTMTSLSVFESNDEADKSVESRTTGFVISPRISSRTRPG